MSIGKDADRKDDALFRIETTMSEYASSMGATDMDIDAAARSFLGDLVIWCEEANVNFDQLFTEGAKSASMRMLSEPELVNRYIQAYLKWFPSMKVPDWLKRDLVSLLKEVPEARTFIEHQTHQMEKADTLRQSEKTDV